MGNCSWPRITIQALLLLCFVVLSLDRFLYVGFNLAPFFLHTTRDHIHGPYVGDKSLSNRQDGWNHRFFLSKQQDKTQNGVVSRRKLLQAVAPFVPEEGLNKLLVESMRNGKRKQERLSDGASLSDGVKQEKYNNHLLLPGTLATPPSNTSKDGTVNCRSIRQHIGYPDACAFARARKDCRSENFFKYAEFFFCVCKRIPVLGYAGLISLLLVLFYLLGTTAADYFSCTLERLSELLNLSPSVAGVTLLAFGNGAPDVFSSVAAFLTSGTGSLGVNTVLGGNIFVTTIVAGSLGIVTTNSSCVRDAKLDSGSFVRDAIFFLVSLGALSWIVWDRKVHWPEAMGFLFIYAVYGVVVTVDEIRRPRSRLPSSLPFLGDPVETFHPGQSSKSHFAIYAHQDPTYDEEAEGDEKHSNVAKHYFGLFYRYAIEWPLTLPRRLTIPIIERDRWSRRFAVSSAFIAPLFLASLWHFKSDTTATSRNVVFTLGGIFSLVCGVLAILSTDTSRPPERFLLPWLGGGFFMSMVWFYITARELVAVMISLGTAINIDPSILGLTLLAWGNSLGDLVGNLSLACNAKDGTQIALSGCYAGPMFNTLVGLGLSFLVKSWRSPFPIPDHIHILYTIGFISVGLLWALAMLPLKGMRFTRVFGIFLILLYVAFLVVRVSLSLSE